MGKNLNYANLVTRPKKLAFYQTPDGIYRRMEGFTDLSYSQNPKEYSRQYVDEEFERTDIVGYAPSISYSFDRYTGNKVLDDIVEITENEYIADLMKRKIVTVDLTSSVSGTGNAKMRDYAVIPDSNGDTTDCLTYSGNFKTKGALTDCIATSDDDWQTITVKEYRSTSTAANITVSGDGFETITHNDNINATVPVKAFVAIEVHASFPEAVITLQRVGGSGLEFIASGIGSLTNANNQIFADTTYYVGVQNGVHHTNYTINFKVTENTVSLTSDETATASSVDFEAYPEE